jgi:hypothetical protein
MTKEPSKFFGLKSSTDLYFKLLYDIERLRAARSTKAVQYAAFDAAVTGSHILDWVLMELSEDAYIRLTGIRRGQGLPKGDPGPIMRFINLNKDELPGIDYCRSISNSVKHMKMSLGNPMKGMEIGSTAKLKYTDHVITDVHVIAYIRTEPEGEKISAVELFEDTAAQWREFLVKEGLWVEQPPDWDE